MLCQTMMANFRFRWLINVISIIKTMISFYLDVFCKPGYSFLPSQNGSLSFLTFLPPTYTPNHSVAVIAVQAGSFVLIPNCNNSDYNNDNNNNIIIIITNSNK